MSRIPPNLLYLTIYNPSLRPTGPIPDDDEDVEEQAHILFYTSKERAVSRDRMLRQIGLAKALVNFSGVFNANDTCSGVHSQSRRMIMISPEPRFWIHACVEVAKTPRASPTKAKEGAKGRERTSVMYGEKEKELIYDFHEGSVHDIALRQDIMRGYERFKLTHGSFTSILSNMGQQALELQLERFFTVWAWSWNLEESNEFREHLGLPLHPRFRSLTPILDKYSLKLPNGSSPVILFPPYAVPSMAYITAQYPPSLAHHLLSLVPPAESLVSKVEPPKGNSPDSTLKTKHVPESSTPGGKDPPIVNDSSSTFLGMSAVNMNVNIDVRKWGWPFGRRKQTSEGSKKKKMTNGVTESSHTRAISVEAKKSTSGDSASSNTSSKAPSEASTGDGGTVGVLPIFVNAVSGPSIQVQDFSEAEEGPSHPRAPPDMNPISLNTATMPSEHVSRENLVLDFMSTTVHLANSANPLLTSRRKIHYVFKNQIMLAIAGVNEDVNYPGIKDPELHNAKEHAMNLFNEIEGSLMSEASSSTETLLSATNTPYPVDRHIASAAHFMVSSPGFTSKSSHLHNAREIQNSDPEISEVFSRGQNPQYWHIARRGLGGGDDRMTDEGEVYVEVFRKEASLTDVDNILAGVVRKCGLEGYTTQPQF